jgi:hypothetical protein
VLKETYSSVKRDYSSYIEPLHRGLLRLTFYGSHQLLLPSTQLQVLALGRCSFDVI